MTDPPDRSWVEFTTGMGDENVIIRGPKPPPDTSWVDYGMDEYPFRAGPVSRFIENHLGWSVCIIVVGAVAVVVGLMAVIARDDSGPALVYDPQVVHRTITTDDGRHVDCAVSDSGMSCDWARAQ